MDNNHISREEAERKIAEKLKEIYKIAYKEYGMKDDYLSLTIVQGAIAFNNNSWIEDSNAATALAYSALINIF